MTKALRISVLFRGKQLRSKTFRRDRLVIGRDPDCDLVLFNVGVSRHHAVIEQRGDGYLLRDLGSSNGTYLDDCTIKDWRIEEGRKVRITKFELVFHLTDAADEGGSMTTEDVMGFGEENTMCIGEDLPLR